MNLIKVKTNPPAFMEHLIFGALFVLALGLLTSTTILALSHILMIVPCVYFAFHTNWKEMPKSAWALLGLSIAIMLSVAVNQDIMVKGWKPIFKVKYFLFGFFSIAPFHWWVKNKMTEKKLQILLYVFLIAATVATVSGIYSKTIGYNPITMRTVDTVRNAGLFGMVMNYAHNMAFFLIIVLGLIIYKDSSKRFINLNFLWSVFILNFLGLYLTYTRGALLALFVAAPFYLFKKNKKKFLFAGVLLCFMGTTLYFFSGENIIRPGSDRLRLSMWKTAVIAFRERPLTGYGYLNFELHSLDIKRLYNIEEQNFGGHAHNNFLEVLASIGFFGFIVFIAWLLLWFIEVYKRDDLIAKIILPFIITFIIGGLTQASISLGVNLFFIIAAFSISLLYKVGEANDEIRVE